MAITINASEGALTVNTTELRLITQTGVVSGSTAINFVAGSEPGHVIVAGIATGTFAGAVMDGDDELVVEATGEVSGAGGAGADGVRAAGAGNRITVSGSIDAADTGIYAMNSASDLLIMVAETGSIVGGSNGDGDDAGAFSAAVASSAPDTILVNEGAIVGEFNPDNNRRIAVLNASADDGVPDGFSLEDDLGFKFFNSGLVWGEVLLGAGEDTYNGRGGGTVSGLVDMGDGDDAFFGGGAEDHAAGGEGADTMHGGAGEDTLAGGDGADSMRGGAGDDSLDGGDGDDSIGGGKGDDAATGGSGNDVMYGADGSDSLHGEDGDDLIRGHSGEDSIAGGEGNDLIQGGSGDDMAKGGAGDDTVRGGQGEDRLGGGGGSDMVRGGGGDDKLAGGNESDTLKGEHGDDTLGGGKGRDVLFGGTGNDVISGGDGEDRLIGDEGNDTLIGQNGSDRYVFKGDFGHDQIKDFSGDNAEKINLRGVASITDFADLVSDHLSDVGGDAVIDDGEGNTITLSSFAAGDLDAGDFLF